MNHKFVAYLKNEHPRVASILSRAYAIKALPGNRKAVRRSKRCDLPEGLLRSVKRGEARRSTLPRSPVWSPAATSSKAGDFCAR